MTPRSGLFLALPGAALLAFLLILPALSVLPTAMTDWEFGKTVFHWIGLGNFREMAGDARFRAAFLNTVAYALFVTPVTVGLGLAIATSIERVGRLRGLYRAVHFLPVVATMTAMSVAWEALLHPVSGLLARLFEALGLTPQNWLMDERLVLPTLAVTGVWQNIGFAVVMFLAGLKTMPRDLADAAVIDGAVLPLDRLRTLTLPLLLPVTLFIAIITAKRALDVFDTVQVLTRGGPGASSEVMMHLLYVVSFERLRAGYGSAVVVVHLGLLLAVTLLQRGLERGEGRR